MKKTTQYWIFKNVKGCGEWWDGPFKTFPEVTRVFNKSFRVKKKVQDFLMVKMELTTLDTPRNLK